MGGFFRQYSFVVDIVAILFCSFFTAKIVGVYVGKSLEVKRSIAVMKPAELAGTERAPKGEIADYNIIMERNIFDSVDRNSADGGADGGVVEDEVIPTGEAVKTSLSLTVLGVLVVGEGKDSRSTATVSSGGGGTAKAKGAAASGAGVYAVGDEESFAPNTKLVRVQPDRIEFVNSGRLEYAEVASEFGTDIFGPPTRETVASKEPEQKTAQTAVKKEAPGKFSVDQREIDEALQNLDKLYTEIRAVPNFAGGKVSGMKILSIKAESLFAKLGLKRGDVLQRINGQELDVKRGFEIFNQLKDQKNLTLDLVRGGAATTLDYEIR